MTEKEQHINGWITKLTESRPELGGHAVCPYASAAKTLIKETPIDSIVPESGYDVIVFVVEDFWRYKQMQKWVRYYNEKYPYYKFFEDTSNIDTFIRGVQTNNEKYNLILCQSKAKKLRTFRKKLAETGYYDYWTDDYLDEVLGEDREELKLDERPG